MEVTNQQLLAAADQAKKLAQYNNAQSMLNAKTQMQWQEVQNAKAMDFSAQQAALNRSFQAEMSNTAHQREVADLIAAGLNPVLSAGGKGASTPSGDSANGVTSAGSLAQVDTSANGAISNIMTQMLQSKTAVETAQINAQAATAAATISSEASKYIAAHYPNTFPAIISRIVEGLTDGSGGIMGTAKSVGEFAGDLIEDNSGGLLNVLSKGASKAYDQASSVVNKIYNKHRKMLNQSEPDEGNAWI